MKFKWKRYFLRSQGERNEMRLCCGCSSPDERRKRACEDEGKEVTIKAAYFQAAFMVADDRTVEWSPAFFGTTGAAERNKANERRETA